MTSAPDVAVQHVDVVVERITGRYRDRVPEVVGVVALVVVADARVLADDRGGVVDPVGIDLRRDQRRAVSERPRVEDRRELAQHAELLDARDACAHLGLVAAQPVRERERTDAARAGSPTGRAFSSSRSSVFELVDVQFARTRLFEERFLAHAHVLHRAEVGPARQITARCRVRRAPSLRLCRHPVGRRARG